MKFTCGFCFAIILLILSGNTNGTEETCKPLDEGTCSNIPENVNMQFYSKGLLQSFSRKKNNVFLKQIHTLDIVHSIDHC